MDFAITGATVVPCVPDGSGPIDDATVAVDGDKLVYVGPDEEFDGNPAKEIDGSDRLILPGFVNTHTHTALTLVRGTAQDVPEIEWMNDALAPMSRALNDDDRIVGSRLGVIEALRSGVTTFGEYDSHVGELVERVYEPIGARVLATETINEIVTDREDIGPDNPPAFDRDLGMAALDRTESLFDRYDTHHRVDVAYGPQAVDMVSQETLETVRDRADAEGRTIHMHVAQGERERRQVTALYGESSVSVLESLGLDTPQLIAAHLHAATPDERERLADAGVRMVGNPGSIATIDGVVPPVLEYLEHDGVVGVGTDQAPGNGRHDLRRELRTLSVLTKCKRTDPRALPAWQSLRLGTIYGAQALGLDDRIGSLEQGKQADLVVVDLTHESMIPAVDAPLHTAIPNLVYAAPPSAIDSVYVAGDRVVADGTVQTIDADEVRSRAKHRAAVAIDRGANDWLDAGSALVEDVEHNRL